MPDQYSVQRRRATEPSISFLVVTINLRQLTRRDEGLASCDPTEQFDRTFELCQLRSATTILQNTLTKPLSDTHLETRKGWPLTLVLCTFLRNSFCWCNANACRSSKRRKFVAGMLQPTMNINCRTVRTMQARAGHDGCWTMEWTLLFLIDAGNADLAKG